MKEIRASERRGCAVHGAVFTVWMLLLTAQVLLVLRDRVAWHRKVGWFVAGWACLMAVMGPWAAIASTLYDVKLHGPSPYGFISVHVVYFWGPWRALTLEWVKAWAKYAA